MFRSGCCTGGTDIICSILILRKNNFSIGRINLIVDCTIYFFCTILFDVRIAIYSVIYSAIYSFALDKMHYQNINMEAIVITKKPSDSMQADILNELSRGMTRLPAEGGFTGDQKDFFFIIISKYEKDQLLSIIRKHDPDAFVALKEHTEIYGNYERRTS